MLARQYKRHPIKKQESSSQTRARHVKQKQSIVPTVAIVLLLLAGAGYFLAQETNFFQNLSGLSLFKDKGPLAATVNGVKIFSNEVDTQYEQIPDSIKGGVTKEIILDQIISQEVLVQEAKRQNIKVSNQELDSFVASAIEKSGWTRDEFEKVLMAQGMTISDLRDLYRVSLVIEKLLNESVLKGIEVSDAEIEEFYNSRISQFKINQPQVEASHILFLVGNDTHNESEALALAENMINRVRAGENFTELALNYSEDPSVTQNGGHLGYFTRAQMVAPFSDAAFNMSVGEISEPVLSQYGYHVIWLTGKRDSGEIIPLAEVKDAIKQQVLSNKQRTAVEDYIKQMRDKATIYFACEDGSLVKSSVTLCPKAGIMENDTVDDGTAAMGGPQVAAPEVAGNQ